MLSQMSSDANTTMTIAGLHPFYTYSCSVAAETIGFGPFSTMFSVKMPEYGEDLYTLTVQICDKSLRGHTRKWSSRLYVILLT